MDEDEPRKINLQRYVPKRGSRAYLIKYVLYSLVLAVLLYLIFSKLQQKL